MTHDELLVRVKLWDDYAKGGYTPAVFQALRAVVELHKPQEKLPNTCQECDYYGDWPCSTIQAIEEQLK